MVDTWATVGSCARRSAPTSTSPAASASAACSSRRRQPPDRGGRRLRRLSLHRHRGRADRRAGGARRQCLADGVRARDRRHRRRRRSDTAARCRPRRSSSRARGRRVPRRDLQLDCALIIGWRNGRTISASASTPCCASSRSPSNTPEERLAGADLLGGACEDGTAVRVDRDAEIASRQVDGDPGSRTRPRATAAAATATAEEPEATSPPPRAPRRGPSARAGRPRPRAGRSCARESGGGAQSGGRGAGGARGRAARERPRAGCRRRPA